MDVQLICIILVFGILLVLENIDTRENFEGKSQGYTNTNPFLDVRYDPIPFSINLQNKDRGFGNFGAFRSYPANPLCSSCKLDRNVVTAPYLHSNDIGDESGDLFGKVGVKCLGVSGKNYNDLSVPFLVAGRSAGRTRQCRRLL